MGETNAVGMQGSGPGIEPSTTQMKDKEETAETTLMTPSWPPHLTQMVARMFTNID